jgi:hypothetical protein
MSQDAQGSGSRARHCDMDAGGTNEPPLPVSTAFKKKHWTVLVAIAIHDADHRPMNGTVDGLWSNGEAGLAKPQFSRLRGVSGNLFGR